MTLKVTFFATPLRYFFMITILKREWFCPILKKYLNRRDIIIQSPLQENHYWLNDTIIIGLDLYIKKGLIFEF